jgi:hypothetical protein
MFKNKLNQGEQGWDNIKLRVFHGRNRRTIVKEGTKRARWNQANLNLLPTTHIRPKSNTIYKHHSFEAPKCIGATYIVVFRSNVDFQNFYYT